MKRILFFLTLLLMASCIRAQTLVLHHADGSTIDIELFTQPRITFKGDRVFISSSVLNIDYAMIDILKFTYKDSSQDVIMPKAETDYTLDGECLVFHNMKAADNIAVYKMNGIRLPVRITITGTDVVLSLSQIPQGAYLLSVNGRTSKFTKK